MAIAKRALTASWLVLVAISPVVAGEHSSAPEPAVLAGQYSARLRLEQRLQELGWTSYILVQDAFGRVLQVTLIDQAGTRNPEPSVAPVLMPELHRLEFDDNEDVPAPDELGLPLPTVPEETFQMIWSTAEAISDGS